MRRVICQNDIHGKYVGDGVFHQFSDSSGPLCGVIEMADGTIHEVDIDSMKFTDSPQDSDYLQKAILAAMLVNKFKDDCGEAIRKDGCELVDDLVDIVEQIEVYTKELN